MVTADNRTDQSLVRTSSAFTARPVLLWQMAERSLIDWFPELKEVENKLGRKTPESLLMWMRDAVDSGDSWRSDEVNRGDKNSPFCDSFSDRICNLRQEMRWLRSADVWILRQLVAVHEGIEAMRWLMEERGASVSRGSSLTGSLSSLVTLDEHAPSDIPCRESLSPTYSPDLTETVEEAPGQQSPHSDNSDLTHQTSCNVLSPEATIMRPPSPPDYIFDVPSSNPDSGLFSVGLQESQPQDLDADLLQGVKGGTIRRALIRSRKARKAVKVDTYSFGLTQETVGTLTAHIPLHETVRGSQSYTVEEEESAAPKEEVLLGYDAQWRWVESQDDVTYL